MIALAIVAACLPAAAQHKNGEKQQERKEAAADLPEVVWQDRGDMARLDIFGGAGGKQHAPNQNDTYSFLREITRGYNPKFDVQDNAGVRWRVKVGPEAHTETAATRLLWAVGYFVDEDYYLDEIKVEGVDSVRRGRKYLQGSTVSNPRLERKLDSEKDLGTWSWFHNNLVGSKELNGLRVLMALINNFDVKQLNNSVYLVDNEKRLVVSDVGATFGRTGPPHNNSKSNLADYSKAPFIKKVTPDYVDFVMRTRPIPPLIVLIPMYVAGVQREHVAEHIPRRDIHWLAARLAQLSDAQLEDCFRAGGYSPELAKGFSHVVAMRIAELKGL